MSKYFDTPIIATMLLSFALTYAHLYWQRPRAPVEAGVSAAVSPETVAPALPARAALREAAPDPAMKLAARAGAAAVVASRPIRTSVVAAAETTPAAATPLPSLPIQISVFNRRQQHKIEGIVQNMSQDHLSLTLRGRNAEGQFTSQGHVELDPDQRKSFGTDSGMTLQEQDDLIVQGVGYAEMSSHVP